MSSDQNPILTRITPAIAVVLSVVIRCVPFAGFVKPEGGFYFYSIDSYDHLRRITLGIHSFPSLANFDYYPAFPRGLGQIWSPGFDYVLSILCLIAGGSRAATETICFFFNPFAAAVSIVLVFIVARAIFRSEVAASVSAIILALNPGYLAYSLPMNFDHHAVEPLVVILLFALPLLDPPGRALSWPAIVCAVGVLLLAIVLWRGSTLYWGIVFASSLVRAYVSDDRALARFYGVVFGIAAGVVSCYCLVDPWGGAQHFSFAVISWFHVFLLCTGAVSLLLFSWFRSRQMFLGWFGCLVVIGIALSLTGPGNESLRQVLSGLSFIRGEGDPWLESNSELRGVFQSRYSLWYSASYLTPFWFLGPISAWIAARTCKKERYSDMHLLNLLAWTPVLIMGFTIRYSHIAGVFSSLLAGYLAHYCWRHYCAKKLMQWGLALGVLVLLLPGIPHYAEAMTATLPEPIKLGLYGKDGLIPWLRDNTPETSHWLAPEQLPEYGILARWTLGARLYQEARRPSLSTAFGWEAHGFYQEAGFWVAEDETMAMDLLDGSQIRYVVAQAVHDLKTDYRVALQGQRRGNLSAGIAPVDFRPERSMQTRLMAGDGSMMKAPDGELLPALGRLRLIYEGSYLASNGSGSSLDLSYYKLFEVVKGASVSGRAPAGEQVILSLSLKSGRGRRWNYLARTYADAKGDYALRVPYANVIQQGNTTPLGGYDLYIGQEKKKVVTITESDVREGRTVRIP